MLSTDTQALASCLPPPAAAAGPRWLAASPDAWAAAAAAAGAAGGGGGGCTTLEAPPYAFPESGRAESEWSALLAASPIPGVCRAAGPGAADAGAAQPCLSWPGGAVPAGASSCQGLVQEPPLPLLPQQAPLAPPSEWQQLEADFGPDPGWDYDQILDQMLLQAEQRVQDELQQQQLQQPQLPGPPPEPDWQQQSVLWSPLAPCLGIGGSGGGTFVAGGVGGPFNGGLYGC